jgi:hypothetical protein
MENSINKQQDLMFYKHNHLIFFTFLFYLITLLLPFIILKLRILKESIIKFKFLSKIIWKISHSLIILLSMYLLLFHFFLEYLITKYWFDSNFEIIFLKLITKMSILFYYIILLYHFLNINLNFHIDLT